MVLSIKMLISHIEFSNSPRYNYSVAEICFDEHAIIEEPVKKSQSYQGFGICLN